MGEDLLTTLSIENYHPSTFLSMDPNGNTHEDSDRDMNRAVVLSGPPDINLPLSVEPSPPPPSWTHDSFDMLDVSLGHQNNETDTLLNMSKSVRKCAKRLDSI